MKRENLTWQELWPLIGDGQCFDYQNMDGGQAFQFVGGQLFFHAASGWRPYNSQLDAALLFKLVDDPSQPRPPPNHLQEDLENYALRIFSQLIFSELTMKDESKFVELAKKDCVKALVSMFETLRADLLREIEEKTK